MNATYLFLLPYPGATKRCADGSEHCYDESDGLVGLCPNRCECAAGGGQLEKGAYCKGPSGEEDHARCGALGDANKVGKPCWSLRDCGSGQRGVVVRTAADDTSCTCEHMPARFPNSITNGMTGVAGPLGYYTCNPQKPLGLEVRDPWNLPQTRCVGEHHDYGDTCGDRSSDCGTLAQGLVPFTISMLPQSDDQ